MNVRASALTPISLIAVGLVFVLVATLAVIESRGITVAPAQDSQAPTLFEPRGGQMSLFAPPYCSSGLICAVLDRVIAVLRRVAQRFPALAPLFNRQIARIQALQARFASSGFVN